MKILSKSEFLKNKDTLEKIKNGAVFIYPTDTIYGIGCDARNEEAVRRIRKIKKRKDSPFSVAVPSKKWILENCIVKEKKWLGKLPGKYTLLVELKNNKAVAKSVTREKSLGVRIPKNWFSQVVRQMGFPIVTTSVNYHGLAPMTSKETLDKNIARQVDFIVYEGKKAGRPSTIIDLIAGKIKIVKR